MKKQKQVEALAQILTGEQRERRNAYTCAIQDLKKALQDDYHEIGIISIIWAIKALKYYAREKTHLTVDELKKISEAVNNGKREWVWIEILDAESTKPGIGKVSAYYQAQSDYTRGEAFVCGYPGISYSFDYCDYGKSWIAYFKKELTLSDKNKKEGKCRKMDKNRCKKLVCAFFAELSTYSCMAVSDKSYPCKR